MLGSCRAAYHGEVRIHHIALRTDDVPRLEAFYRDVFGLPLANDERPRGALNVWLQAGDARFMLEARGDGEPTVDRSSMELVAFAIDAGERSTFEARLARAGVTIEQRSDFTLYFRDPDGRRVAVSHYPERSR
jgi:glyoxylase I family protein